MSAAMPGAVDPVQRILDVVEHRRSGAEWMAKCPAHSDGSPSLSIKRTDNGAALVFCHAGCSTDDVMAALGLTLADLYVDGKDRPKGQWRVGGGSLNGHRDVRPAPERVTPLRPTPAVEKPTIVAEYPYRDEHDAELFRKIRRSDKSFGYRRTTATGKVEYKLGDARRVLYRLPELLAAVRAGEPVYIVEGEKDADRLAELGIAATTNHDGAGKWDPDYNTYFIGAEVVIVADRDEPGYRHAYKLLRYNLARDGGQRDVASVCVVESATTGGHDDVSDHLDADYTLDQLVPIEPDDLAERAGERSSSPAEDVPGDGDRRLTGWERTDLGPILDGTYQPPQPGILHRTDGPGLFYPGLLHQVIGQPESGKTWLALLACAARLAAGEPVLYLDYESDPAQVVARLRALGADREALVKWFDYRRPEVGVEAAFGAFAELLATAYVLVVVDGVTDALGTNGASMIDNDEVGAWIRQVPERIARTTGAAVVLIDHVAKGGSGGPSRYAVGAQQKLEKIRGVSYYVEPRTPIAPGQVGELTVIGTKDTAGQVKRHGVPLEREPRLWAAARVVVDATDPEHLEVRIAPPFDVAVPGEASTVGERGAAYERNTVLMERISRVLETAGEEIPAGQAVDRAKGKRARKFPALQALAREGYTSQRTLGAAQMHGSVKPFREGDDPGPPAADLSAAAPLVVPWDGVGDPAILTAGVDLQ